MEKVQQRDTKVSRLWEGLAREGRTKEFLFIQEQRRPREKPIPNFQWLKGNCGSEGGQEAMDFSRFRGNIGLE